MSTRSRIGLELDNGKVLSIYCHWDGYPACNGVILATQYDREKTFRLIQGGSVSRLGFSPDHETSWMLFDPSERGTEYFRDRGEGWEENMPTVSDSAEKYFRLFGCGEEYIYLLRTSGKWEVSHKCGSSIYIDEIAGEYLQKLVKKYWEA